MREFIPVSAPALVGNEKAYVMDCLETSWISSNGKYIELFETAFAGFSGTRHALSCCNGTVALHLALLALGVQPGDEVLVPTLTYVATANAVAYCGARPVLIDSEAESWNMDPERLEEAITARTRGIVVVHLYGHPADMDAILDVARRHGLFVVEDAAEAHGACYKGRQVGAFGDIATFSFYGNKIISTGEGGMVCTNDDALAQRVRLYKGQGQDPARRFWFPQVGYNYRMTNIEAAIGLAQLEQVDWHIARRRIVAGWYRQRLQGWPGIVFSPEKADVQNVYWLSSVLLPPEVDRDAVMQRMLASGVETRPFFYPMHVMPVYRQERAYPVAERLARCGINLPSYALLQEEQVATVVEALAAALAAEGWQVD